MTGNIFVFIAIVVLSVSLIVALAWQAELLNNNEGRYGITTACVILVTWAGVLSPIPTPLKIVTCAIAVGMWLAGTLWVIVGLLKDKYSRVVPPDGQGNSKDTHDSDIDALTA